MRSWLARPVLTVFLALMEIFWYEITENALPNLLSSPVSQDEHVNFDPSIAPQ